MEMRWNNDKYTLHKPFRHKGYINEYGLVSISPGTNTSPGSVLLCFYLKNQFKLSVFKNKKLFPIFENASIEINSTLRNETVKISIDWGILF